MTSDEMEVFCTIANCELSLFTAAHADEKAVVSTKEISRMLSWTKYRAKKAIKGLVEHGIIERASIGRQAVETDGEYRELVCEAMPPKNGYAMTNKGFESEIWKNMYDEWCKSMEKWANGFLKKEKNNEQQ